MSFPLEGLFAAVTLVLAQARIIKFDKSISYDIVFHEQVLTLDHKIEEDVAILCNNKPVDNHIHMLIFDLINTGSKTINDPDFHKKSIEFPLSGILDVKRITENGEISAKEIVNCNAEANKIECKPQQLLKDGFIRAKIIYLGDTPQVLKHSNHVSNEIDHIGELTIPLRLYISGILILFFALVVSVAAFSYSQTAIGLISLFIALSVCFVIIPHGLYQKEKRQFRNDKSNYTISNGDSHDG
jgi:hypothetical protein